MSTQNYRAWNRIVNWGRRIRCKLILWAIRKYHPEGISYDPDRRMYTFRWTKELHDDLFRK